MMTDEELQSATTEISDGLAKLAISKEPLTKEERGRKNMLLSRQAILERIKEAKEKGRSDQELKSTMDYSLLTEWGDKHPFWAHIMRLRMRNTIID